MASSNVQHPSPMHLLPDKLWFKETGTNYREWKAGAVYLIQRQGLIGFINGSCLPSSYSTGNTVDDAWKRTDEPLKQGILSLLEKDVAEVVKHLKTSREIWLKLETMFQEKHGSDYRGSDVDGHVITMRDWKECYPLLYKAALMGDWDTAEEFFAEDASTAAAKLNSTEATALHVAVESRQCSIKFVEKLAELLPNALIAAKDAFGDTALNIAASVGNKEAAIILVNKIPNLVYIPNNVGDFPVHTAAKHAKRSMLKYLISVTKDDCVGQNPYAGVSGLALLISTIQADSLDIALYLVKKYPHLAKLKHSSNSALKSIAQKKFYHEKDELFILVSMDTLAHPRDIGDDIESLDTNSQQKDTGVTATSFITGFLYDKAVHQLHQNYYGLVVQRPVPRGKIVKQMRLKKQLAVEILKYLCQEIKTMNAIEREDQYRDPILIAAKLGNLDVVEQIVKAFPDAIYCSNPASFKNISHMAVEHRAARVLSFICETIKEQHQYFDLPDINGNNLLHLAAQLAPSHKLAGLPNPAMQMQSEIQWYKVVEILVRPRCREQLNHAGKSPRMIFEEEHKSLLEEAEKWVKSTVNSCAITAALISTISFAAAITVPGGSSPTSGYPFFGKDPVFTLFAISDAISLIASVTCLIVFLDISTTRYATKDFFFNIPTKVKVGIAALLLSLVFMMFAFSATLYLVFGHRHKWVLILTAIIAAYIVIVFIFSQGYLESFVSKV